jgi:hypothetical protein
MGILQQNERPSFMGMHLESLEQLELARSFLALPWTRIKICEFGEQGLRLRAEPFRKSRARAWFLTQGVPEIISIDWIGMTSDAVPIDLSQLLRARTKWKEHFDLVTNFGTIEHIEDDYAAFSNAHLITRIGGIIHHNLPLVGSWPQHGLHWYSADFPSALAEAAGYELLVNETQQRRPQEVLLIATLRKQKASKFIPRELFNRLTKRETLCTG